MSIAFVLVPLAVVLVPLGLCVYLVPLAVVLGCYFLRPSDLDCVPCCGFSLLLKKMCPT
jgi:hypothetical protein